MNDDMMLLFSSYIDGVADDAQKRRVEVLLRQDPSAREIFEEMKSWSHAISESRPAAIQAPPELRQGVMDRLRAEGGPGNDNASQGNPGGGWLNGPTGITLMVGTVLVGLVGGMMVWDHQKTVTPSTSVSTESSTGSLSGKKDSGGIRQPQFRGDPMTTQQQVSTDDIESLSDLEGDVYVSGRGRTSKLGGFTGSGNISSDQAVPQASGSEPRRLGLEESSAWDNERLMHEMDRLGLLQRYEPESLAELARKYNLHPGLFVTALNRSGTKRAESVAQEIRRVLDENYGREDDQKLKTILQNFGIEPDQLPEWRKIILQP